MKFKFIILYIFFCSYFVHLVVCATKDDQDKEEYPWFFAVASRSDSKVLCGAVLIDSEFAVTSSSCVKNYEARQLFISNLHKTHDLIEVISEENIALLRLKDASSLSEMITSVQNQTSNCYTLKWRLDKNSRQSSISKTDYDFNKGKQSKSKSNSVVICDEGLTAVTEDNEVTYFHEKNEWIDAVFRCVISGKGSCDNVSEANQQTRTSTKKKSKTTRTRKRNTLDCNQTENCIKNNKDKRFYPVFYDGETPFLCSFNEYKATEGGSDGSKEKECYEGEVNSESSSKNYYCHCKFKNNLAYCYRYCE